MNSKKISIAADHGGFDLKSALVASLSAKGFEIIDNGPMSKDSVDYPDYAKLVCDDVNAKRADFGILVCTTGIGMSIAANKISGIRAALCQNADAAEFSRRHNNANVICFGAKYVSAELADKLAGIFAQTEFEGGRHARRVQKFMDFENC